MPESNDSYLTPDEFVPSLREAFGDRLPDEKKILKAVLPVQNSKDPAGIDRRQIALTDGKASWLWNTPSLRELFRGDKQPPTLGDHPEEYNNCFMVLDLHLFELSRKFGDLRDKEIEELFSQLRKRPDGKSLGFVHDYMWQACALVLGTHVLSQAEFEAITARLERSARRFGQGSTSRNYTFSLRTMFAQSR